MSRIYFLVVILSILLIPIMNAQLNSVTLEELKWKNRIILTFSNDESVNQNIEDHLIKDKSEVEDRDIVYFLFTPSKTIINSNYSLSPDSKAELTRKFFNENESLKVILIGKDGGVKMEKSNFDLAEIFRRIDSMPMRIREMQQND